jgi:hypothetical protein
MPVFKVLKKNKVLNFGVGILLVFLLSCGGSPSTSKVLKTDNQTPIVQKEAPVKLVAKSNRPNSLSPLGIGLNGVFDWSTQFPFINIYKSSRNWITQCGEGSPSNCEFDTQEQKLLNLDENGWVKSLPAATDKSVKYRRVETVLLTGEHQLIPGRYLVLYDGEGKLSYSAGTTKNESLSKPGREVIDIAKGTPSVFLAINATNPSNYLRNIRVIRESHESAYQKGEIFTPEFIDKIKSFRSIRFMDWMGTNNSKQKDWADRPKPEDFSWALKGVPLEIMVALANKVQADPWFNMPHLATDEYVSNFAQLVKKTLDPNLTVYVEYSNEAWNWQFEQAQYANQQGRAKWGDHGDAYMQWNGMKGTQFCSIWKKAYGNQSDRVKCVISSQTGYRGLEEGLLNCPLWVAEGHEPCYKNMDVYAMTGYISGNLGDPANANLIESWLKEPDGGFSKAIQQLRNGNLIGGYKDSLPDVKSNIVYFANVAKQKGLELVAYEGGQHITASGGMENNEKIANFFVELNRRPEMYDLYMDLLKTWKENGGTLFEHFVDVGLPGKYGSWGALEYVTQTSSPKYKALIDFIKNNQCWWEGCAK